MSRPKTHEAEEAETVFDTLPPAAMRADEKIRRKDRIQKKYLGNSIRGRVRSKRWGSPYVQFFFCFFAGVFVGVLMTLLLTTR